MAPCPGRAGQGQGKSNFSLGNQRKPSIILVDGMLNLRLMSDVI